MTVHSQVSPASRRLIADITAGLLSEIQLITDAAQQAIAARARADAQFQERREAELRAIEKRRARILGLARSGLRNLLAIASQPDITQMIEVSQDLHASPLSFYEGRRLSGDAWDHGAKTWDRGHGHLESCDAERVVLISFTVDTVAFFSGSNIGGGDINWETELGHNASTEEQEALLQRLVRSVRDGTKGRIGLDFRQNDDEWDPDELLVHVLAECAKEKNCEYYLSIALKNFKPSR